jgi:heat shock protein HslJ
MTDKNTLKIITLACAVVVVFAVAITVGCIANNTTGNAGTADNAANAVNTGNTGNAVGTDATVGTGATGNTGNGLTGTEWILESIANESGLQPVPSGVTVTLKFDEKNLGGNGGCNGYGATYTTDGNKLSINQESFISTLMYCDTSSPTEAAYKTALTEVASYKISGDKLELSDDNGKVLLVFTKMNA